MKKDKIVVFPIIIKPTNDSKIKYTVNVPDLDRDTQGKTIAEAIDMGKDLIGTMSLVEDLPKSNVKIPKTKNDEIATLVTVNISEYKRKNDERVVKKTLTIPNYLNEEGKAAGLNFSAILSDGIKAKLGIE
ncbi:type II toxin-antitoxin system HicB family antitoxin [Lactobacillus helveticus]|uniref:type II toxin-antitoxin system HicB family antitoxin n=1 Tax=Lactobacillus helveticus TaxID=1587 RepID=UPI0021A5DABF|nr:type II toxin-antitoxin system HicB family antitoxin [Lactobacillus helveticus]MCT3401239.1 type II toxin-antitoxin system HicB family antitoxin [Lactobacillus helveticus]